MEERLQKLMAAAGVASRRGAEEMISAGRVTVNGRTASLGERADTDRDEILVDGKPLPAGEGKLYLMLNKPRGYLTSVTDDRGRRTVMELLPDFGARVYPVGRLDMDSEGLLILTNDGELANQLMHPSQEKEKVYHVTVNGRTENVKKLAAPIVIDGRPTRPARVRLLAKKESGAVVEVRISEGRNRQIRRLCEAAGLEVRRLKRVSLGSLRLGELRSGQWRRLTDAEVRTLKSGLPKNEGKEK